MPVAPRLSESVHKHTYIKKYVIFSKWFLSLKLVKKAHINNKHKIIIIIIIIIGIMPLK